jgi:hypothetical protein
VDAYSGMNCTEQSHCNIIPLFTCLTDWARNAQRVLHIIGRRPICVELALSHNVLANPARDGTAQTRPVILALISLATGNAHLGQTVKNKMRELMRVYWMTETR